MGEKTRILTVGGVAAGLLAGGGLVWLFVHEEPRKARVAARPVELPRDDSDLDAALAELDTNTQPSTGVSAQTFGPNARRSSRAWRA